MRILVVSSHCNPERGGAERNLWEISRRLALRGHDITIFTAADSLPVGSSSTNRHLPTKDIRTYAFKTVGKALLPDWVGPWMPTQSLAVLSERRRFDLVHVHGYGFYPGYGVVPFVGLSETPVVLTAHTSPDRDGIRRAYDLVAGKWLVKFADAIICVTEGERALFRAMGVHEAKLCVIPNGVDCGAYSAVISSTPFTECFGIRGPYVLYVGRLARNKGVDVLIRALRNRLATQLSLRLAIVGSDCGELHYLQMLAESEGVESQVIFCGPVPDNLLLAAYRGCDLLVLPSRSGEAQGIVLLEAMAAGKPIVATSTGGIPFTIREPENGLLVPPNNSEALRVALDRLLDDQPLRHRMESTNLAQAKEYDWDKIATKTEMLYKSVIQSRQD